MSCIHGDGCSVVEEASILWESLVAIVGGLRVGVIGDDEVDDSLWDVVGGNDWASVLHSLADLWQLLVLVVKHALDLLCLSLSELSHFVIVIVVDIGTSHLHESVTLLHGHLGLGTCALLAWSTYKHKLISFCSSVLSR